MYYVQYAIQGLIYAIIGAIVTIIFYKFKSFRKKKQAMNSGIQALLRGEIVQAYYRCEAKGYCPRYELENVESLFKQYEILDGNGAVAKLVKEMREMPQNKNN